MADLGPIVQVKEKPPVSYRDKLCDKKSIMTKVGANWECNCCPYLKMPAFTCNRENGCEEREGYYSRCKKCNKKYMTWKRCKKWKKLLKRSKQHKSLKFITLTIKNPITFEKEDAREFKQMIMKPWNKLKRRLIRRGIIQGGLYAYEYTYDEQDWQGTLEGEAISTFDEFTGIGSMLMPTISNHPHLHIIAVGNYIPQQELLSEWRECVGHEQAGVHIFAIKNPEHALGYVTKYITKSSESGRNREPFGSLRKGGV